MVYYSVSHLLCKVVDRGGTTGLIQTRCGILTRRRLILWGTVLAYAKNMKLLYVHSGYLLMS